MNKDIMTTERLYHCRELADKINDFKRDIQALELVEAKDIPALIIAVNGHGHIEGIEDKLRETVVALILPELRKSLQELEILFRNS